MYALGHEFACIFPLIIVEYPFLFWSYVSIF